MLFKQIFGVKAGLQCVREIIFLCLCAGVVYGAQPLLQTRLMLFWQICHLW